MIATADRVRPLRLPRPSRISSLVASRVGPASIEPATVVAVLERYGLRPGRVARNLRLGRRSRNVAVGTDLRGPVVVKRYRPQWTVATVRGCHSILVRLEEAGFPALRLVRTEDGATWFERDDGLFAVFDFVAGVNYSMTFLRRADRLRLAASAGRTLARMHRALEGFTPDGDHHLGLRTSGAPVRDAAWHGAKLDELASRSPSFSDAEARDLAGRLIERSAWLREEIAALEDAVRDAGLPRVAIHGDYGLHNLIVDPSGTPIPVDFEVARLDHRVNDLISAAGKFRTGAAEYDVDATEAFYRAYGSVWPLQANEIDQLPVAWRRYRLRAAVQYWNSYFETSGPNRKLRSALEAIEQAAFLDRHADTLERLRRAAGGRAA